MKMRYLLAALSLLLCVSAAMGAVITVHSGGSIQDAIHSAQAGDAIEIESGTYYEHLIIEKPLTLKGVDTGGGKPVIDGSLSGTVIIVHRDGVKLDNLKIINCDPDCEDMEEGLRIRGNCCIITKCEFEGHNIALGIGRELKNNLISDCIFANSRIGLVIRGVQNVVNNNQFTNSNIVLDLAKESYIINNLFEGDQHFGISIYDKADGNIIAGNTFRANRMGGIEIEESSWGPTSHNNRMFHNNFLGNGDGSFQVTDDGENFWDNGKEGNYWSDYSDVDSNNDGIWDHPYRQIALNWESSALSDSQDNYPLAQRWTGTETAPDFGDFCSGDAFSGMSKPTEKSAPGFGIFISLLGLCLILLGRRNR
jgi:parallel beta-helix repeat protein